MSVKVGDLYEIVSSEFWTTGKNSEKTVGDRRTSLRTKLNMGEIIEIRYPFEWHFRTEDNKYFHADPEEINKKCKPFGKINRETVQFNRSNLKEILEKNLYKKAIQGVIID